MRRERARPGDDRGQNQRTLHGLARQMQDSYGRRNAPTNHRYCGAHGMSLGGFVTVRHQVMHIAKEDAEVGYVKCHPHGKASRAQVVTQVLCIVVLQ